MSSPKIAFVTAGGAGAYYMKRHVHRKIQESLAAAMCPVENFFIDTNDSVQGVAPKEVNIIRIPGLKGAARIRSEVLSGVRQHLNDMLEKLSNYDLVVIAANLSGGSGSTVFQVLGQALATSQRPFLMVGATAASTLIGCTNVYKTVFGMDNWAHSKQMFIPFVNISTTSYDETSSEIVSHLDSVRMLVADTTRRFDQADMAALLNLARLNAPATLAGMTSFNVIQPPVQGSASDEPKHVYAAAYFGKNPEAIKAAAGLTCIVDFDAEALIEGGNEHLSDGITLIYTNDSAPMAGILSELKSAMTSAEETSRKLEEEATRRHRVASINSDDGFEM